MSITDVSSFFDIDWKTVKDCEKKHLRKKFRHIPLKDVRIIGVDELFVRSQGKEKYITIVRDLESGAVLYVGDGKGSESLNGFIIWPTISSKQKQLSKTGVLLLGKLK